MDYDSESEEPCVVIFGQKFCKLEHFPIKKRILLRDSALCQRTFSSAKILDQNICSPPVAQNSDSLASPSANQCLDPIFNLKEQADNLKSDTLDDNSKEMVMLNYEKAYCHAAFSGMTNKICTSDVDNANKVPKTVAVLPLTVSDPSLPIFAPVAEDDDLVPKSKEAQPCLTDNVIEDSSVDDASNVQPDYASSKDLEAVQSLTQDNRILWDLNVEMDAWEKPDNHLEFEPNSAVTTSDVQAGTNHERTEDYRLKGEETVAVLENDTKSNVESILESANSVGICKDVSPVSTDVSCVRADQYVAAGSVSEPSMGIVCTNTLCYPELTSRTVEHSTSTLGEKASESLDSPLRQYPVNSFVAPNSSVVSTEEQNCENKNIIVEGEGSVNNLQVCNDEDNGSSKKGVDSRAGQLDIIDTSSCAELLERRVSIEEGNTNKNTMTEAIKAAPSTHPLEELTRSSPKQVDIDKGNQLLSSRQEGCHTCIVEPLCVPDKFNQDATVFKQDPSMDKDLEDQNEDYEDGELRDMDMHCWNENETEMGETECLDYEPFDESIDDLDESQTSLSPVENEGGLMSNKCWSSDAPAQDHLMREDGMYADDKSVSGLNGAGYETHISNTQLDKKLSGWDQLPKDHRTSLEKVHNVHVMISRTSRSELQSCIDIPTRSEDAEEKETVVERRIRAKDMDDLYPAESSSSFVKFSGKRRPTLHMHERNRAEDWDSERRSSVNYHDIYDNHSGSRRMIIHSKGREHHCSRSPSDKSEAYDAHISYTRYSRGRYGGHADGSGRSFRGGRNGYRGSLTDDRSEPELCVRQQFFRRDRSFSPRPNPHFSETFNRSRSRSRSPPLWMPPYERMASMGRRRSPDFSTDDRVKRTRLPFWKANFTSDREMRYTSPSRSGFIPQYKSRWNDDEDFVMGGPRDRSPVRSYRHKEKFDASSSNGRFKSSEEFRPLGYRGRMHEIASPERVRGYIGRKDRRKREDIFETGHQEDCYKGGLMRQYRRDAEDVIAPQNLPSKEDFLEDGETRSVSMRNKESGSRTHAR